MQIGHRIGDRKHVIEREMNVQTGQISENIELENLDEAETDDFKKEWRQRSARTGLVRHPPPQINSNQLYPSFSRPQLAIEHHSSRRKPSRTTRRSPQLQPSDTIDLTGDDTEEIEQLPTPGKRKSFHDDSTPRKRRHD